MSSPTHHWKPTKRQDIKATLATLSPSSISDQSTAICDHLSRWLHEWHPHARNLASYAPLADEASLLDLQHLLPQHQLAYPLLSDSDELNFHLVSDHHTLTTGRFGVKEPKSTVHPPLPLQDIDLFLCPLLAVDPSNGHRLGKGLGCYDRVLHSLPSTLKIGIAFREQLVHLPAPESHDISMTHLATPDGIITIS